MAKVTLQAIEDALGPLGLIARSAFHSEPGDQVPPSPTGAAARSLVPIGNAGPSLWQVFSQAPEAVDGERDPLDRWSRRVIGALAQQMGGWALFPFGGPPHHPFIAWAKRAEAVRESPLGVLIHPDYGLWHAYRGALAFAQEIPLPPPDDRPCPCEGCVDRPCLGSCPVGAFTAVGYDVEGCVGHIAGSTGNDCMHGGCLARRACPVGADYRQPGAQLAFHMQAFRAARLCARDETATA